MAATLGWLLSRLIGEHPIYTLDKLLLTLLQNEGKADYYLAHYLKNYLSHLRVKTNIIIIVEIYLNIRSLSDNFGSQITITYSEKSKRMCYNNYKI